MSSYQQPSFKFETNVAKYDVEYQNHTIGEEKWLVKVSYDSQDKVRGIFELPISWSREYVFGWLSRMELSDV